MVAAVLIALCGSTGCVQRRFTIRSNPPGALVYIDDYQIGTTPVSTDFTYYGTRKIRLVKDGYETLTLLQPVPTPWYEWPGLDFVSENLVPGEIRDERILDYQMQPQVIVPQEQLLGRAEELRRGTHSVAPDARLAAAKLRSAARFAAAAGTKLTTIIDASAATDPADVAATDGV